MRTTERYIQANKRNWEQKARCHFGSRFYDVASFRRGKSSLRPIEMSALGAVTGKRLLHLQCHFGLDTLSWARLGAEVVGVDFSEEAIERARGLAEELQIPARFVCSNIYDLKRHLRGKFDIVFVSYGCLGWLPDIPRWAEIVAHFLAPRGVLHLVDYHPVHWMLDGDGKIAFPYEGGSKPFVTPPHTGTYADRTAKIDGTEYWWNHGLAKIMNSLIEAGLAIEQFDEYPYSYYDAGGMRQRRDKTWVWKGLGEKVPVLFSIKAEKR